MQEERNEPQEAENNITTDNSSENTADVIKDVCDGNSNDTEAKEQDIGHDGDISDCDRDSEDRPTAAQEEEDMGKKAKKLPLGLKVLSLISVTLAVFSVVMRICFEKEPWAGEVFYRHIVRYLQAGMAKLTTLLPFSLAETILIMLPVFAVILLVTLICRIVRRDIYRLKRTLLCIFTAACLIFSNYILNLSMLYCRLPLSELSGIDDSDITAYELYASTLIMTYRLDQIITQGHIQSDASGASVCPYGFDELDDRINAAFDKYAKNNDWISPYGARSKIIAFSDYMTYTHISGIYTQYTGEANINVNYPDYIVSSTIAHEKAHQRGIAPEDEANLVAMFVLCESGDPYLEYCGYMSVFTNLTSDCLAASRELYINNLMPYIPKEVSDELAAYSRFFEKYQTNEVSQAVNTANDAYLKLNGEEDGVISYDKVSGMAAKYILLRAEELFTE